MTEGGLNILRTLKQPITKLGRSSPPARGLSVKSHLGRVVSVVVSRFLEGIRNFESDQFGNFLLQK